MYHCFVANDFTAFMTALLINKVQCLHQFERHSVPAVGAGTTVKSVGAHTEEARIQGLLSAAAHMTPLSAQQAQFSSSYIGKPGFNNKSTKLLYSKIKVEDGCERARTTP